MSSADQRLSDPAEATPATAMSRLSLLPIQRFDDYAVVARLGSGGMAEVILGLAQGPQGFRKLVAIKRLHAHCEQEPQLVRMFLHEAALAALLQHPNIVQTHKVGGANGRHFIAMEYLEGQTLARAIPRLRTPAAGIDPVMAARIVADALAGLAYAHDAAGYDGAPLSLVHRDVSPQNLFLTYDGQVKLLDFGVAKAAGEPFDLLTPAGTIKGKLGYIAPEQTRGEVDRRADVWSAGVVLWELLAGGRLFKGEDAAAKLRAVLSDEIPHLRALRSDLPEALAQITARALQRDPGQRYESAAQMKSALEAWLTVELEKSAIVVAPDAAARTSLAVLMQARFASEIHDRRAAVLGALSALEQEREFREGTLGGSVSGLRRSPLPEPLASVAKHKRVGAFAAGALIMACALVALVGARKTVPISGRESVQPTIALPAASPASAPAPVLIPASPSPSPAPASAPLRPVPTAVPRAEAASARRASAPNAERTPKRSVPKATEPAVALGAQASARAEPLVPAEPAKRGRLRLDATPYALVSLEGKRLGITPIDVELPAATHTLTLRNPERGIETTYRVEVISGESLVRRVELE